MKIVDKIPEVEETIDCEKHGSFVVEYMPWIIKGKFMAKENCSKCVVEKEREAEKMEALEREELRQKMILEKKIKSGLNKRHIDCWFENYKTDTEKKEVALNKVKSYVEGVFSGNGNCLVMSGRVGTGKTHLAAAIVNVMVEKGKSCHLVKMSELIRDIKSTWAKNAIHTESDVIEFYSELPLLIIDEIGIQFCSDTEKLFISEIIDNRYQDILPTVLISNLDVEGIKLCIGERSYDRLRQDGGKIIAFDWESERAKK